MHVPFLVTYQNTNASLAAGGIAFGIGIKKLGLTEHARMRILLSKTDLQFEPIENQGLRARDADCPPELPPGTGVSCTWTCLNAGSS